MKILSDELLIKTATEAHFKALPHTSRRLRPTTYLSIAEAIQDRIIEINQNEYLETDDVIDKQETKRLQIEQTPGRGDQDPEGGSEIP